MFSVFWLCSTGSVHRLDRAQALSFREDIQQQVTEARGHSLGTPTAFGPILTLFYSTKFAPSQLFRLDIALKMQFFSATHFLVWSCGHT
jgi:hypothetical protein